MEITNFGNFPILLSNYLGKFCVFFSFCNTGGNQFVDALMWGERRLMAQNCRHREVYMRVLGLFNGGSYFADSEMCEMDKSNISRSLGISDSRSRQFCVWTRTAPLDHLERFNSKHERGCDRHSWVGAKIRCFIFSRTHRNCQTDARSVQRHQFP